MSRLGTLGNKLYSGEISYDFVARAKVWYAISAVLILISLTGLFARGLTLGIEFRGGAEFRVQAPSVTTDAVRDVVSGIVGDEIIVQSVGDGVRVQTEELTDNEATQVRTALAEEFDVDRADVSEQRIGPSWGEDISQKALRALVFFLLGLVVFLSLYFEWKMALAAILALIHDLLITVGIYALIGFEVTPATVIGFLTILGYSLYDTVVVFDKVRENTAGLSGGSRMTYSGAANLALNQTLVRSINTSVIALLPIGAILFAGVVLLGAGPLKDLSLALFIGVAAGTYSSIFIATPVLAEMKEREPAMQALAKRVAARKSAPAGAEPSQPRQSAAARQRAAAANRAGSATAVLDDEQDASGSDEATPTQRPAPPAKRSPAAQRQQPRKGKNRPSGKKRR
jgi:preprotein translocase subunit SecF